MSEMGVTIISDGLGKPFSVCSAADDNFVLIRVSQFCFFLSAHLSFVLVFTLFPPRVNTDAAIVVHVCYIS